MNTQTNYQPMTQDPHKDEREEKDDKCCYHCFCWFFQISVWILLVTSIVLIFLKNEIYSKFLIAFGVADFIYLILELFSPTGKYLCNKSSDEGMYQKLLVYFRTPPRISFHCECYHYETTTLQEQILKEIQKLIQQLKKLLHIQKHIICHIIL